ncbi:hypothetical protein BT67DRAFT_375542 [Trichocladium antarcticum]|uniref:Heterokaryon incompatibility domain-containing protein n=1 Tax=Trichocladium antarcticum TaxID=1450529 RepID=A0AAN6UNQ6_9PEZI|nr:hypothetical protein BT67DRAFT_375542 [Trichocladium antarcticum]
MGPPPTTTTTTTTPEPTPPASQPRTGIRSTSTPAPARPRPPYTYAPLPGPRHIRLLRLLHYDPVLAQVLVTLDAHPLDAVAAAFTALSYTWGSALEAYAYAGGGCGDGSSGGAEGKKGTGRLDGLQVLVVPDAAFATFRCADDLRGEREGALVDLYTTDVRCLEVGGNLAGFLRGYLDGFPARYLFAADGRRRGFDEVSRLWVDALCIDQGSAEEKARQIPLMGEIYSGAGRVLAWLGGEQEHVGVFCWWHRVVWPAISRFGEAGGREAMMKLVRGDFVDARFWREVVGFEGGVPEEFGGSWARAWAGYWAFYRGRRYFHRAWIVQEVVVAGRLEIMVGKREELSWDTMKQFAFFLGHAGWIDVLATLAGDLLPSEFTQAMVRGFGITDIAGMQGSLRAQSGGLSADDTPWPERWWAALSAVRRRECFVQQDKVLATVGILQQALPPSTPLPFPVEATATCEEVYTHAATTLLLNCPSLPFLSFLEHPFYRTRKALPSWVPDLTTSKHPWPLGVFDTPFHAFPRAPPDTSPPPRSTTPAGHLHLRGLRIDTIHTKSAYQPPLNPHLATTALRFLASNPPPNPATSSQPPEAALMHTLTCHEMSDVNRGTAAATARLAHSFRAWLLAGLGEAFAARCRLRPGEEGYSSAAQAAEWAARRADVEGLVAGLGPRALLRRGYSSAAQAGEWAAGGGGGGGLVAGLGFRDQLRRVMLYRCLFATVDGWWGVCAEWCEAGDEVWLLEGGAVPYVLRRRVDGGQERFVFCGECYVHGGMEGALVGDGDVEGRLQEVVIV